MEAPTKGIVSFWRACRDVGVFDAIDVNGLDVSDDDMKELLYVKRLCPCLFNTKALFCMLKHTLL